MRDTIKQLALVIIAGLLAIPVANWTLTGMESQSGLLGAPVTLCQQPLDASFRIVIAIIWFAILAFGVGKMSHRYTGALVYGLCWTLVARRGPDVGSLLRMLDSLDISVRATYFRFMIESVAYAIPAAALIYLLAKKTETRYEGEHGRYTQVTVRGTAIACVIGLVACWLFVRTDNKGQAVFGVLAGCALASTIVRLIWPHCNGSVLYIVPVFVGLVGHLSSVFIMSGNAMSKLVSDQVWPLARPLPIDYIGPGIFGIALGIGIARTFGQEEDEYESGRIHVDARSSSLDSNPNSTSG